MVMLSGYGERERSFPIVTVPWGSSERERIFPSVTGPEEAMWSEDNPGVCPGKTFVMRPSRWGGSVGGCVWLERCVLMMSSWDDGDTYMCCLPWSAVGDSVNGPCGYLVACPLVLLEGVMRRRLLELYSDWEQPLNPFNASSSSCSKSPKQTRQT